jgi:iduronate 2-sulfatase
MYHYNVPNSIGTDGHDDPASWEVEFNPSGVDRNREHSQIVSLKEREFGGTLSWLASDHPEPMHTDALLAEDAIWALQRCATRPDHPFFLSVGFFRPHTPYVAPKEYFKKHPLDKIPLVTDIAADQEDIPQPALASAKPEQLSMTDQQRREALQAYRASISFMDAQVGKVLAALESSGLADRTIIVFTSDHGYHTGEHGLWQKMSLFEESARVPLLIRVPGWTDMGTEAKSPVSHIDLYPTLLELAAISPMVPLQGQSLVPMLKDPNHIGRGWALTQVSRGQPPNRFFGYSLRTERWRYTEWDQGEKGRELYDHQSDPKELKNLADLPEFAAQAKDLRDLLAEATSATIASSVERIEVKPGPWAPVWIDP